MNSAQPSIHAYLQFVVVVLVLIGATVADLDGRITADAYVAILGAALGYSGAQANRRRGGDHANGSTGP